MDGSRALWASSGYSENDHLPKRRFEVIPAEERGLSGVRLVVSDALTGLEAWQRCNVHFYRNVLVPVPSAARPK